jgi:serine O-acetyltransferase
MEMVTPLSVSSRQSWITQNRDSFIPEAIDVKLRFNLVNLDMDFYTTLVYARRWPVVGQLAYYLLKLLGIEFPVSVPVGEGLELAHGGFGVVIHPHTVIGKRVKIYPGVGLGRADIYRKASESHFEGIVIEDDVILSPGAKVLCKEGVLRVGRGTVVGANAVLLESTGENQIWAGIPAKCVGRR